MELAIISDTHMPRGGRALPEACVERLRAADAILHAGDLIAAEVLEMLRGLGPPVHVVQGNVDDPELALPRVAVVDANGARIVMTHDAGPAAGRLARMRKRFAAMEPDAVVFGHSHIPLHEEEDGFQIFNPGSPTERRRAPTHTMGIARAEAGTVRFELIDLG